MQMFKVADSLYDTLKNTVIFTHTLLVSGLPGSACWRPSFSFHTSYDDNTTTLAGAGAAARRATHLRARQCAELRRQRRPGDGPFAVDIYQHCRQRPDGGSLGEAGQPDDLPAGAVRPVQHRQLRHPGPGRGGYPDCLCEAEWGAFFSERHVAAANARAVDARSDELAGVK